VSKPTAARRAFPWRWIAAGLGALVLALVAFLALCDWNRLREPLACWA
jgi:hypothetical protein